MSRCSLELTLKCNLFTDLESAEYEICIVHFPTQKCRTLFSGLNCILNPTFSLCSWILASVTKDAKQAANVLASAFRSKHHWLGKAVMYKTVFKTRQGCLPNSLSSWLLLLLPLCFTQCRIFLRGDREFYFRPWCFAPSRLPMAQFPYSLHFEKH